MPNLKVPAADHYALDLPTQMRSAFLVFVKLMLAILASQFVVQKLSQLAAVKSQLSLSAVQKLLTLATELLAADVSRVYSHE